MHFGSLSSADRHSWENAQTLQTRLRYFSSWPCYFFACVCAKHALTSCARKLSTSTHPGICLLRTICNAQNDFFRSSSLTATLFPKIVKGYNFLVLHFTQKKFISNQCTLITYGMRVRIERQLCKMDCCIELINGVCNLARMHNDLQCSCEAH